MPDRNAEFYALLGIEQLKRIQACEYAWVSHKGHQCARPSGCVCTGHVARWEDTDAVIERMNADA